MTAQEARNLATWSPDRECIRVIAAIKEDVRKAAVNRKISMHLNLRAYGLCYEQQQVVAHNLQNEGFRVDYNYMTLNW